MDFCDLSRKWLDKLEIARLHKWRHFGEDAQACMQYVKGPHRFLIDREWLSRNVRTNDLDGNARHTSMSFPLPTHLITVNKTAEMEQLFGPWLYDRNPVRTATAKQWPIPPASLFGVTGMPVSPPQPGQKPDPAMVQLYLQQEMAQQQYQRFLAQQQQQLDQRIMKAKLLADGPDKGVLNQTPGENNQFWHNRNAIADGLIAGRGLVLTKKATTPTGLVTIKSEWHSVMNLLLDPDALSVAQAWWAALRCVEPVWKVEEDYRLKPGTLKGNWESQNRQAEGMSDPIYNFKKQTGRTSDLLVYWKIWSRMGIGGRLDGVEAEDRQPLDLFGKHCFLAVAEGVDWPLNIPPALHQKTPAELRPHIVWETPFYLDDAYPWPFTELDFHPLPGHLWPYAHMTPALGYQQFLDWAFSAAAGTIMRTFTDTILVDKSACKEIIDQLMQNEDLRIVEVDRDGNRQLKEYVETLQYNPMNQDLFTVLAMVEKAFERATGMSELMYGTTDRQMRSAQESEDKSNFASIRPNDMRKQCYAWQDVVARKEAIAWHYHASGRDVAPLVGDFNGMVWDSLIAGTDFGVLTQELDCSVQAGSMERPDFRKDQKVAEALAQMVMPMGFQVYTATGDPSMAQAVLNLWGDMNGVDPAWKDAITLPKFTPPSSLLPMPEPATPPKKAA